MQAPDLGDSQTQFAPAKAAGLALGPDLARAKNYLIAAIVLLGLALTYVLAKAEHVRAQRDAQARFERLSERVEVEVERRLRLPLYGLKGARGVFAASSQVERTEFRDYVESRQMALEFPGVRGFGFIERVMRPQLERFVAATRRDGAPDFEVRSNGQEADLFVIKYIEPLAANSEALGFDIGQEAIRREAVERALRSGDEALSGRISLVQDSARRPGFLLLLPIFERGVTAKTPAQREQALLGFVYAPLIAEELFAGISEVADGQLDFELLDSPTDESTSVAYQSAAVAPQAAQYKAARTLSFAGRSLTVATHSRPEFDRSARSNTANWIAAGGGFLTLLLAFAAWLLINGRARAEAKAIAMTADLERLARVARGTSNAVIASDPQGLITWVNEGFSRISGYAPMDVMGRRAVDLLGVGSPVELESLGPDGLAAMALSRIGGRAEFRRRRPDGEIYWVEADVQPIFDAQGRHTGFIEISLDISERKHHQQVLALALAENKALLETIHQHAIVSVADADGVIIEANAAFTRISGYSQEELLGSQHRIVNSGQHSAEFWDAMWFKISSGQSWHGEICNRAKDGSLYWVDTIIAPMLGDDGRIQKYVSIRTDITAAKRSANVLVEQQERLNRIIEGTNAGTWDWNIVSGELRLNDRWAEMLGYSLLDLAPVNASTWTDHCHPDDLPKARALLMQHFFGESAFYECELRMRHRDGHWVWVLAHGKLYERTAEGEPLWIAGTHLDISAAKRAAELLQHQQLVLDRAERLAGLGAWEIDLATQALTWSTQTYRLHELDPDQPVTSEQALTHFPAADRERLLEAMRLAVEASEPWDLNLSLFTASGRFLSVRSVGEAVFDDSGAVRVVGTYQDVTQQRLLEADTKRSHAVLRSVLDNLPCALSVFDADLKLLAHNQQFLEMLEFPASLFAGPTTTFESIIRFNAARGEYGGGPDIEATVAQIIERARHPSLHQFERQRPNGLTLEVRGAPMPDGGFVTTYFDVSERKRLEDAQRRSNELLNIVLESLPCGLTMVDAELKMPLYNGRYAELYGLEPAFLAAAPLSVERIARLMAERGEYGADLSVDDAIAAAKGRSFDAMAAPHQWARRRPNGLSLEMRSNPVPSGGFVTTYMDVGERDRAEAEVRRAEVLLRGAIDAVNEAFVLFGPDDRLVFCNEKYRQMYAISADLIVPGASFEEIIRGGAERGQYREAEGRVDAWVTERLAIHRRSDSMLIQKLEDGRWVRVIERKMDDGHTVGFRIDITDLVQATEAAEDASRSKSQFLANMSHEIRTPMNAILGMLKLLQKTELNTRQQDYAGKTEGAARSLLGLLNDILDFSKVEAGKMTLDPQPFRVEQLLRDLSVILSANVGLKPLEVLFDIDPALPAVLTADAMRLQQVLINLAGNAIKFTPRGEVVVSARLLAAKGSAVEIEFAVRDSGIGIAPEHQARIFSGFTQAEASTTRRFGGTGLGLAISQRLVQLMGGELRLESAPGQGSCFSFRLPMLREAASAVNGQPRYAKALRALIVDDNPIALEVLGHMSEALGWQVELAASGPAALTLLQRQVAAGLPYEVVLIDWQMPTMDGFETAQRIRELAGAQATPLLVMVTAHGREMLAQRSDAEQSLLDGFLVKPVTALMLQEAVQAARGEAVASTKPAAPAVVLGPTPLQGMRVLVVEDNLNNQQVAQELLEDVGASVQLADNGQIGVDLLLADPSAFDIVLMDMQMPVMDGYTATRMIRGELGLTRLPIVAMTANAMASDREACLAAGMNEHVGKPFDLEQLVALLLRLTGRAVAAAAATTTTPRKFASLSVPAALCERANAQGFDVQAAMDRFMGKTELFSRMVRSFNESARTLPAQLTMLLAEARIEEAGMALHSFRGLAATLGGIRLAALGGEGETALKRGEPLSAAWVSELDSHIQSASRELSQLAQDLAALAPKPAAVSKAPPPDAEAFKLALQQLMQLLRDFDMGATDAYAQLRERHAGQLGAEQAALDAAVTALEFDRALALCAALAARATA